MLGNSGLSKDGNGSIYRYFQEYCAPDISYMLICIRDDCFYSGKSSAIGQIVVTPSLLSSKFRYGIASFNKAINNVYLPAFGLPMMDLYFVNYLQYQQACIKNTDVIKYIKLHMSNLVPTVYCKLTGTDQNP